MVRNRPVTSNFHSFLSILVVGALLITGLYPLFPVVERVPVGWILPLVAVAYLGGYGVHVLVMTPLTRQGKRIRGYFGGLAPVRAALPTKFESHRTVLADAVRRDGVGADRNDVLSGAVVEEFWETEPVDTLGTAQIGEKTDLYSLLLSYNHLTGNAISRYLQAIYSLFRSLVGLTLVLAAIYTAVMAASAVGVDLSATNAAAAFGSFTSFYILALPILAVGFLVAYVGYRNYMEFFVEYLVTDFVHATRLNDE